MAPTLLTNIIQFQAGDEMDTIQSITKRMISKFSSLGRCHGVHRVFDDFVSLAAYEINCIDLNRKVQRSAQLMQIRSKYSPLELTEMAHILGDLNLALSIEPHDVLGNVFSEMSLTNGHLGQVFTPQSLADAVAMLQIGSGLEETISKNGFVTVMDPACGAGAMPIAFAKALAERGYNYQKQVHMTLVDIDSRAVFMSYIQLSLLGIPATVVHGNSLSLKEYDHLHTPFHFIGNWDFKLRASKENNFVEIDSRHTNFPHTCDEFQEEHTHSSLEMAT